LIQNIAENIAFPTKSKKPCKSLSYRAFLHLLSTQTRVQVPIDQNKKVTYEDFSITTPKGREEAFGQTDHVRIYGQDYVSRLKKPALM